MSNREAIDVALAVFRRPALVRSVQDAPLPEGMITVIRIAAGAEVNAGFISPKRARNAEEAHEAAVFFLQQVLFLPHSDNYRLLGLKPGVGAEHVREHKRWLLKWLHPDRNHNKWESALFQRVAKAAEELEKRLDGAVPAPAAAIRPASRRGRHNSSRRRLARFALGRVHRPLNWRGRLAKHLRRLAVSAAVVVSGVLTWGTLTGSPLSSAFASLASWPVSWLRW